MKYLILLSLFLVSFSARAEANIPRGWIVEEVSINDIHEHFYSFCLTLKERGIGDNCVKDTENPFQNELVNGYKVYSFNSPEEYWQGLAGRRGFVLEINNQLIESIVTGEN